MKERRSVGSRGEEPEEGRAADAGGRQAADPGAGQHHSPSPLREEGAASSLEAEPQPDGVPYAGEDQRPPGVHEKDAAPGGTGASEEGGERDGERDPERDGERD